MDVEVIMSVAGVGMIVTVVSQILSRAGRDEQATLVSISGIIIVLILLVEKIGVLFDTLCEVFGL